MHVSLSLSLHNFSPFQAQVWIHRTMRRRRPLDRQTSTRVRHAKASIPTSCSVSQAIIIITIRTFILNCRPSSFRRTFCDCPTIVSRSQLRRTKAASIHTTLRTIPNSPLRRTFSGRSAIISWRQRKSPASWINSSTIKAHETLRQSTMRVSI